MCAGMVLEVVLSPVYYEHTVWSGTCRIGTDWLYCFLSIIGISSVQQNLNDMKRC